jgi:hypothetical protein
MSVSPPPISPDGAYWWDGQAWRPMPLPAPIPQAPPPEPAPVRPDWLPAGAAIPGPPASVPAPDYSEVVAAPAGIPAPAWASPATNPSRRPIIIAAAAALVVMVGGAGAYAVYQAANRSAPSSSASVASVTPSADPSPSPSPVVQQPLTGQLGGDYCPVAHRGDAACWKGSFLNTGPAIGKLALIFVIGSGYHNWFASHANWALSGFYTTPGCVIVAAKSEMVCGAVPPGGQVNVDLGGDVTTRGTWHYAVKFADIATGSPVYVDQNPDGTHDVVSWTELIR